MLQLQLFSIGIPEALRNKDLTLNNICQSLKLQYLLEKAPPLIKRQIRISTTFEGKNLTSAIPE